MDLCLLMWVVICLITPACTHHLTTHLLIYVFIYLLMHLMSCSLTVCTHCIYLYACTFSTIYSTVVKKDLFGERSCRICHISIIVTERIQGDLICHRCLYVTLSGYDFCSMSPHKHHISSKMALTPLQRTVYILPGSSHLNTSTPSSWNRVHQASMYWDIQRNVMTSFSLICNTDSRGHMFDPSAKKHPDGEQG